MKRTLKRTLGQSITLSYSSLEPYFCQPELLGKFCYPWIPHTSSRRTLKLVQEQKSLKIGDGPETRETELDMLQGLRNKGARKRRERGRAKHLLKLIVKDKLLHSGKVPIDAELRLLRREK